MQRTGRVSLSQYLASHRTPGRGGASAGKSRSDDVLKQTRSHDELHLLSSNHRSAFFSPELQSVSLCWTL
ncbi:unnamed protein product [Pleuronectes platessa]|uniref:Uncharacterized protein n=1 Tax=Pleuronectes platessa TaxID=8262 RepID=A0A9N7U7W7_PLEPL|nr:unnamed protein product [Pleuronectes platessa]